MKDYTIFTDCHKGSGDFEWPGQFEYGPNVVFLGDNIEMKNIRKSEVPEQVRQLAQMLRKCGESGANIVASNHGVSVERDVIEEYDYIDNGVCFTHGHRAVWEKSKCDRWEAKGAGLVWYKLAWIRLKNGKFKDSKHKNPSAKIKKKLAAYARERGCRAIVIGHQHYNWRGFYNGIEILICGRGRQEVTI